MVVLHLCVAWTMTASLVFICRQNPRPSGILLFPDIPDSGRHLPRRVFVSWESLGRSGNSKIPNDLARLGFSQHMKTSL